MNQHALSIEIGKRLLVERHRAPKITQAKAARMGGTSSRMWGDYEKGRLTPPLEVLLKFAKARGIEIGSLVPGLHQNHQESANPIRFERIPVLSSILHANAIPHLGGDLMGDWTIEPEPSGGPLFALTAWNMEMAPKIETGDIILCAPEASFVKGAVYVVLTTTGKQMIRMVDMLECDYLCFAANPVNLFDVVDTSELARIARIVQVVKRL